MSEEKLKIMDGPVKLEKCCMAFKLKDGQIFLIHNDDIRSIAEHVKIEMMLNEPQYTLMIKDPELQKARELYEIFKSEKDGMTAELRMEYLKKILELGASCDFGVETFKEYLALKENQKPT